MLTPPAKILLTITLAASAAVWALAVYRLWRRQPVLPWREEGRDRPTSTAVILAAGWLVLGVAGKLGFSLGEDLIRSPPKQERARSQPEVQLETAEEQRLPTLGRLQTNCAFLAVLATLLMTLLVWTAPRGADSFGLAPHNPLREAAWGGFGFLASAWPVFAVLVATQQIRSPELQHTYLQLLRSGGGAAVVVWIALTVVIVGPVFEELLYRVTLQGALEQVVPPAAAVGIVAVGFSAVHGFPDSIALVPLALLFGWIYYRTRSFTAVVVMHGLFNLWNLVQALLIEPA